MVERVDCTSNKNLCAEYNITKYPMRSPLIKIFLSAKDEDSAQNFFSVAEFLEKNFAKSSKKLFELNDKNFYGDTAVGRRFVMFYAAWCGSSKIALPKWKKLANSVNGVDMGIVLSKIDCKYEAICSEFKVSVAIFVLA